MKNETEAWKTIPGWETYEASTLGRIRNNKGRLLSLSLNKVTGYQSVFLKRDDGHWKTFLVHRLILKTFNPIEGMDELQCDHINNKRSDNRLVNLQWLSRKENNSKPHARKMKSRNAHCTRHSNEFIKGTKCGDVLYFINQADAANQLGCSKPAITKALGGTTKRVKGWTLTYVPRAENPELDEKARLEREERLGRTRRIKLELTKAKRNRRDELKKEVEEMKQRLKSELVEKMKEWKELNDRSSDLWKEIQTLRRKIEELDFKKRKWDMHAVIQMDMSGNPIREWRCVADIFKELGLDVNPCVKGLKNSVGGFRWAYKISRQGGLKTTCIGKLG